MRQFRQDPTTGRWVIIAPGRAHRPRRFGSSEERAEAEPCPFCSGNEALTPPEIWAARAAESAADGPGWRVRVVPNKYPALTEAEPAAGLTDNLYPSQAALGAHEVIIESPAHDVSLGTLSEDQFSRVVLSYRQRLRELSRDARWRYALLYKNQGDGAGATLEHVHSQLVAMPAVPQAPRQELERAKAYFQATGECIYCVLIERETGRPERVIFQDEHFLALCPFAARFAYETWLVPKNHLPAFADSPEGTVQAFARSLKEILKRIDAVLGDPPFNFFIHSMPIADGADKYYHWQLRILPQLARAAGFEWGSGAHINSVAPEEAARVLRDGLR